MSKFIHFGCWNKGGCFLNDNTEQTNGLTNVMRLLNDKVYTAFADNDPYQFISIAGDNYYPSKIKSGNISTKIFDEQELKSGFECLPKDISINVIMGNHDYEKNLNIYNGDKIINIDGCEILDTEHKLKDEINPNINTKIFDFKLLDDTTKILMVDTTMYDDKYIKQNIDCYFKHPEMKHLINESDDLNSKVLKVRNTQTQYIKDNLRNLIDGDNLIIIGHHPITGFKYKKGKVDEKGDKIIDDKLFLINSPGEPFIEMLYKDIHLLLKNANINVNYYYLCADLHQYQIGNISIGPINNEIPITENDYMFIKQYIVGTGGADLDPYELPLFQEKQNLLNDLEFDNFIIKYLITEEEVKLSEQGYGILECNSSESRELTFKFIKTSKDEKIESMPQNKSIEQLKELLMHTNRGGKIKRSKNKTHKKKHLKNIKTNKNKGKRKNKPSKVKNKYTKKRKYIKTKKYKRIKK